MPDDVNSLSVSRLLSLLGTLARYLSFNNDTQVHPSVVSYASTPEWMDYYPAVVRFPRAKFSQAMLRGRQEAGGSKQRGRDSDNDNAKTHFTCAVYH